MLELEDLKTLRKYNSMTEEEKLEAVRNKKTSWVICFLLNPSEAVQLEAVKQFGHYIEWIENPSEQVQIEAVRQNGSVIQYIKNPSEEVQLEAVRQNYNVIRYIENPTEQVQLEAVKKYHNVIQDIENPTEKVQLDVVKQDYNAIRYIKNPTEKVIKLAEILKIRRDFKSVSNFLDLIKHSDKAYIQYLFDNLDLFNNLDEDVFNELEIGLKNLLISKEIDLSIINNNGNGSGPKP